ncbi:hypothetical protein MPSEU_000989000 [Mayamaea pseudoterrestris]|nr:hypothetical protein MPSEU_000989000 [Mayamaea pseudoterrestris]
MMKFAASILLATLLVASTPCSAASSLSSSSRTSNLIARALADNNNNNNADYSFLSGYSMKFQGCHHVQQWNDNSQQNNGDGNNNNNQEDQDSVRILTKRLARFRLCPSDSCSNDKSTGCTSKFGDYIIDLSSFVSSYLQVLENEQESVCATTKTDCEAACDGSDDEENCVATCYDDYGMTSCLDDGNDANDNFQPANFAYCTQVDIDNANGDDANANGDDANDMEYYIGPYCADQGGDVKLGVFSDNACTTFASNGETAFYKSRGFVLPYSETSLVSTRCLGCQDYDADGDDAAADAAGEGCATMYSLSGKCETRLEIDYPNESSCSYMEGIKIVRSDGVIRTSTTRKSKAAAVAIGLFLTTAVLLAAYVYYLRTKLARAQINLAAAAQPLT